MTVLNLKQNQLSQICDALARLPKDRSRQIPMTLRRQLADYAEQRMAAGDSRLVICRALGIGDATLVHALQSWFDRAGLNLLTKRIEEGTYACLWGTSANSIKLTMNELALLLEGCTMVGRIPLSPKAVNLEEVSRVAQVQFQ